MAEIQDIDSDIGEIEAVEEQQQSEQVVEQKPEIPERYRGKSAEDLMKMHQEAEKLIDRQGREVGEVRKLADELIKSQLTQKPVEKEPEEVDFFADPQAAIQRQIENHPKIKAAEQFAQQARAEQARMKFAQMHPDAQQITQDAEFRKWVDASKVRQSLFRAADNYDVDAADELLSTFKELRGVRQRQVEAVDNTARDKTLKAAAVDSGGTGESSRKIYRRADLLSLQIKNPSKYESMGDEIMAAYREGRVK